MDSGLGGTEGDVKAGSDSDISFKSADDRDEESVVADQASSKKKSSKKKAPVAKVTPAAHRTPSVAASINLDDISQRLKDLFIAGGGEEMQIITVVQKNVPVEGFAPVKYQDLLVVQILLPGCAVLESLRIVINRDDPRGGKVSVDLDSNLSVGSRRTKQAWYFGNSKLAEDIEALIQLEVQKLVVEGSTPAHGRVDEDFDWPEDLPSQLNPVDPFVLGFRPRPTAYGRTLFETKTVKTDAGKGKSVPGMLVTAFFFVEKHTHVTNDAGKGLRFDDEASDDDSITSTPTPNKRRRGAGGSASAAGRGRAGLKTTGLNTGTGSATRPATVEDFDFFDSKSSPSPIKTG